MSTRAHGPYDIAQSVMLCGSRLKERNPGIKVVIAGILPTDKTTMTGGAKIQQTNEFIRDACWKEGFFYLSKEIYNQIDEKYYN